MGAAPSVEAAPEAIAQVEPPQRSGWSRLWLILAVIATVLGVALMATGQYLLDDYWQDQIEKAQITYERLREQTMADARLEKSGSPRVQQGTRGNT